MNGDARTIPVPQNGKLNILGPDKRLHATEHELYEFMPEVREYEIWGPKLESEIKKYEWR
jgi:hypothetical protein